MPGAYYQSFMNCVLSVKVTVQVWCVLLNHGWVRKLQTQKSHYQISVVPYRLDRNRDGSGVIMYVHSNYSCEVLRIFTHFYLQKLS